MEIEVGFLPENFILLWLIFFCLTYGIYLSKDVLLNGFVNLWLTGCHKISASHRAAQSPTTASASSSSNTTGCDSLGGLKAEFLLFKLFTQEEEDSVVNSIRRRNFYVSDPTNVEISGAPSSHDIPERFLLKSYQPTARNMEDLVIQWDNFGCPKILETSEDYRSTELIPTRFHHSNTLVTTISSSKPAEVDQIEHWLANCLHVEQNVNVKETKKPSRDGSSLQTCSSSSLLASRLRRSASQPTMNRPADLISSRRISNSETCLEPLAYAKTRDPLMGTNVDEFLSENIVTSQMDKLKNILTECCEAVESQTEPELEAAVDQLPLTTSLETIKVTQLDLLDGLNNLKKMIDLRVRQTLSAEEKRSRRKALKTIIGANCLSYESLAGERSILSENPLRRTFSHCDCGCDQLVKMVEDLKATFVDSQVSVQRDISVFSQQMDQLAKDLSALKSA